MNIQISDKPVNLCNLGMSVKLLFTGYLITIATGYLFALVQILFTHGMADGQFGLSLNDIVYSYYGDRSGSIMESKLNGSMKYNAPEEERFKIIQWSGMALQKPNLRLRSSRCLINTVSPVIPQTRVI